MRVTFTSMFRNGLRDINQAAEDLARAQREVSSLRRVRVPSDDPAASAAIVGERSEMRVFDSYAKASDSVDSRLRVIDSALSDVISNLTYAQTTAAAARPSFVTQAQRDAYANQLTGVRDAILSDLSIQYRNTYVFSGTAATVAPYEKNATGTVQPYAGDSGRMVLDIDRNRSVEVTIDARSFVQGADAEDLFQVFDDLIAAVQTGDAAGIDTGMAGLQRAFDRVTAAQSRVGNGLATIEDNKTRLGEMRRASDTRRSELEDANLADAITRMQQAEAARNAAVAAVGATARLSLLDFLR